MKMTTPELVSKSTILKLWVDSHRACVSNGWSSKQIAITIRMYPGAQYNARVYHQCYRGCDGLSKSRLDDSYAKRVAYHLKKWCGIVIDRPPHLHQSKGPRQSDLCKGCKDGHCTQL